MEEKTTYIQLQFDCNALHVWPKINKLNYYPLSASVCASIKVIWKVFLLIWPVFIFNCKLRIVYWRDKSVRECVHAFICACVCVWLLFVIAIYDNSLEAVVRASADCVLFLSPSVFFFSLSLAFFPFEICEGIFKY